jgi:hypothetical protein
MGNITGTAEAAAMGGMGEEDTTETTDTELERMATSEDQNTGGISSNLA